ncbi:hypothetical protein ACI2IX_07430 [Leifsonia aquatica]|uniref:hypothetical protein n=1 Tax=Leifsonia aquatica TaxID=144185 RepID=UPI00384F25DC
MSWKDFDLELNVVGGPRRYEWRSAEPVLAAPVLRDGHLMGYLVTALDPAQDVLALTLSYEHEDYVNGGSRYWTGLINSGAEKGVPAADLFRTLLGAKGPDGAGSVSPTTEQFESTDAVFARLNPDVARRRAQESSRSARAERRVAIPAPTRDEIDAVLRGQARPTPEIQARIAALDEATHVRTAPEDVLVALAYDPATLPAGAAVGTVVHEPTFLTSTFLTGQTRIDAPTTLILRVTKGTPALYTPPGPGESGAGVLLLGRGIDWQITSLAPREIQGTVLRAEPRS